MKVGCYQGSPHAKRRKGAATLLRQLLDWLSRLLWHLLIVIMR